MTATILDQKLHRSSEYTVEFCLSRPNGDAPADMASFYATVVQGVALRAMAPRVRP